MIAGRGVVVVPRDDTPERIDDPGTVMLVVACLHKVNGPAVEVHLIHVAIR